MIVRSSAPTRISLFGGGTDVGEYCRRYGGLVLNMAINIRQEIILNTTDPTISLPKNANIKFYEPFIQESKLPPPGIKQTFDGEITGGIGSSAAAAVALYAGLHRISGERLKPQDVAEQAWNIEVKKLGMFGGKQDQYAAAFGGVNVFEFPAFNETPKINPLDEKSMAKVIPHILLFHTGFNRQKANIQDAMLSCNMKHKEIMDQVKGFVIQGLEDIFHGDVEALGNLLHESWEAKKASNNVTNKEIDDIYSRARRLGAWGGKICGSGGGGYMVFIAPLEKKRKLIDQLGIPWVDFEVDYQGVSTRIL